LIDNFSETTDVPVPPPVTPIPSRLVGNTEVIQISEKSMRTLAQTGFEENGAMA
jgi:hypothetical protein